MIVCQVFKIANCSSSSMSPLRVGVKIERGFLRLKCTNLDY